MSEPPRRLLPAWFWPALVVVGLILAYTLLPLKTWLGDAGAAVRGLGALGVVLYMVSYVLLTMLFFPAAIMALLAGFAWGAIDGFAVAIPSATLAAVTGFATSRYLFHGRFRAWVMHRPRAAAIDEAVNRRGPWLVLLLRFSPVAPFPLLNYALGLARIPLWQFALATFFGMMPISFLYTYTADAARMLGTDIGMSTTQKVFVAFGIVVTIAVTLWVGRTARRALREAEAAKAAEGPAPVDPIGPEAA